MSELKQVIVMRHDLNMRKGKMISQGSHASVLGVVNSNNPKLVKQWLESGMTKICVRVESEEELLEIYQKALDAGLEAHMVIDAGRTEFKEPTKTCISVGPNFIDKIDPITRHLKLL